MGFNSGFKGLIAAAVLLSAILSVAHVLHVPPQEIVNGCEIWRLGKPGPCNKKTSIAVNTLRTGDADLRFYVTTVQDGWRRFAFLRYNCAGRVTQICVFTLQLRRTGDTDLRFYVTTVQDGWRRFAFLTRWISVHLQVLLSATPQGGMFPELSHPQALLGSLVRIS